MRPLASECSHRDAGSEASDNVADASALDSVFDEEQHYDEDAPEKLAKLKLPETLLQEPLAANQVMRLSKKEKHMYNVQKGKYDQVRKKNEKKPVHPRAQVFSLADARSLVKGQYHKDEEEDGAAG